MWLNRRYIVTRAQTTEGLVQALIEPSPWGAQAFELNGLLYLPARSVHDGSRVYGVVQIQGDWRVRGAGVVSGFLVAVAAFDGCDNYEAVAYIAAIQAGLHTTREPVNVLIGLRARLPQSLSQIASRIRSLIEASMPTSSRNETSRRQFSETP